MLLYHQRINSRRKARILREAHSSIANRHFGENKSIEKARQLCEWKNMETDVINFVKKMHSLPTTENYADKKERP